MASISLFGELKAESLPYEFDFSLNPFDNGWTEVSVSGAQTWTHNASFQNASMSAFSGGCQVNEDWLISPSFDLSSTSDELLSFDLQLGFAGDNGLEVLYSTNYSGSGDPNAATWTSLTSVSPSFYSDNSIPNNTSATFGDFTELQSVSGTVYVAFKFDYESGECSTWRVANFSLISGADPVLTASESEISGLSYGEGDGPSASASYTLSGENLTGGNIAIEAPSGFQVSLNNIFFSSTLSVSTDGGQVSGQPRTLYVRLAAGLSEGSYSGNITHSGGGASLNLPVSGSVFIPGVYFVDFEGEGETKGSYASGTVNLSGLDWNMTEALIGTAAADFKNGERSARLRGYGTTSMSMIEDKPEGIGIVSFLYARYGSDTQVPFVVEYSINGGDDWVQIGDEFTAGAEPATFQEEVNVEDDARIRIRTVASSGTSNRRMNVDDITITDFGIVPASIIATPVSVAGLNYSVDDGPSASGSFSLSASNLDPASGQISVTAPANFEVSLDESSWSGTVNVSYSDGGSTLASEEVFVRLAAGLSQGDYEGDVACSGGGGSTSVNVSGTVSASVNPELFDLSSGDYSFTEWGDENPAGSFPDNMRFLWSENPSGSLYDVTADGTGLYNCGYDLGSRPRFNGNGEEGFSFITTGNAQYNNCTSGAADSDRYVGSAVIGLNTSGVSFARISWLNRLVTEGAREFGVRLQYRLGDSGAYSDFAGSPEYTSTGKVEGDTATTNFVLPSVVLNQSEVYLRFVYYQTTEGSGNRPEMGVDDILITTDPLTTPFLSVSEAAITDLYYTEGSGPSAPSSYLLEGINLSPAAGVIDVSAPANFELSLDGSSYSSTLAIGYGGGSLSEEIFVRLVGGLDVGLYPGGNLVHSGGSANTVQLTVSGEVGYPVNLGVGDINIIGYRSVANDGIAFVSWVDIEDEAVILFTDRGWTGTELRTNENLAIWKNTTGSAIAAGTVVKIGGPELGDGEGTNLGQVISGNLDSLAQAGDNIFALQGSSNFPVFIYGLSYLSDWLTEGEVTNPTSYLPSELDNPLANVVIFALNAQYDDIREGESSFNPYRNLIADAGNWFLEDDGGLFGNFNTDPFTLGAAPCTANGGTLTAPSNRSFCVGTGTPKGISVTPVGASGTNQIFALINNATGDIVATRTGNSNFNLDVYPTGNYGIRYMRFEDDVSLAGITNISQAGSLTGCFSLASNVINVFLRDEPEGGTLSALTTTTVCANAGPTTGIQVEISGNVGENSAFGLVDPSNSNEVLATQLGTTFNLNGFDPGTYRIFHLSYQQGVNPAGVQFPNQLQGCFDLSNGVTVNLVSCLTAEISSSPNPTADMSFVTFSNPRDERATLEVYDMSGRMLSRLFDQTTNADQEYRLQFNGSALPNGVYMYRLTTPSEVIIEKFMIAR